MQVYAETNTVYCFSTSCPTHGHSLDQIGFVQNHFKLDNHGSIMKCKQIIHEMGRWPADLFNPFLNPRPNEKVEEKKEEHYNQEGAKLIIEISTNNPPEQQEPKPISKFHPNPPPPQLKRNEYGQLCYITEDIQIHLLNEPDIKSLNSLRIGIVVKKNPHQHAKEAIRQGSIDLYHYETLQKFIKKVSELLQFGLSYTTEVFAVFIELLEKYKLEKHLQNEKQRQQKEEAIPLQSLTTIQQQIVSDILRSRNPLTGINTLIGKSGIVGEENNRLFLFSILTAYKLQQPLSALIQGSSGSGKTSLFAGILQFFPERDVYNSTRITDGSLYNFGEYELMFKILANEDIDGLSPQALFALRELVSKGFIISSTTIKDEDGNIKSAMIKVCGPVSFVGCTTKAELYEDNMGRVFTIAVDESIEQTKRIIDYQNKKSAGKISKGEQEEAILLLKHIVQQLKPVEVINPFAELINLPDETHQLRRLNALFKIYIEQITRMHQYCERPDKQGVYRTTKQHIQLSADSFFECIVLKIDELNGEIRKFYEWLKEYIRKQAKQHHQEAKEYRFTQREIRQAYNKSKASISNYFQHLTDLEYISTTGGNNRKVMYQIEYWDDYQALRKRLKGFIQKQIDALPDDQ